MGFLVFIAAALAGVVPEWLKDLIAPADEDSEKPP